jgi:hypothetical protein
MCRRNAMKSLTIHGIDSDLEKTLKDEAKLRRTSMNKLVLQILKQDLSNRKQYHDLDHLAGTWSIEEAREFEKSMPTFEHIDEEMWK